MSNTETIRNRVGWQVPGAELVSPFSAAASVASSFLAFGARGVMGVRIAMPFSPRLT